MARKRPVFAVNGRVKIEFSLGYEFLLTSLAFKFFFFVRALVTPQIIAVFKTFVAPIALETIIITLRRMYEPAMSQKTNFGFETLIASIASIFNGFVMSLLMMSPT